VGLALALGYLFAGGTWPAAGAALIVAATLAVYQWAAYRPPFPVGVLVPRSIDNTPGHHQRLGGCRCAQVVTRRGVEANTDSCVSPTATARTGTLANHNVNIQRRVCLVLSLALARFLRFVEKAGVGVDCVEQEQAGTEAAKQKGNAHGCSPLEKDNGQTHPSEHRLKLGHQLGGWG
jgi:hypothetical protein